MLSLPIETLEHIIDYVTSWKAFISTCKYFSSFDTIANAKRKYNQLVTIFRMLDLYEGLQSRELKTLARNPCVTIDFINDLKSRGITLDPYDLVSNKGLPFNYILSIESKARESYNNQKHMVDPSAFMFDTIVFIMLSHPKITKDFIDRDKEDMSTDMWKALSSNVHLSNDIRLAYKDHLEVNKSKTNNKGETYNNSLTYEFIINHPNRDHSNKVLILPNISIDQAIEMNESLFFGDDENMISSNPNLTHKEIHKIKLNKMCFFNNAF
jgi:hypothetical protein